MRASPPLSPAPRFTTKSGKKNCGKSHISHRNYETIQPSASPIGQDFCPRISERVLAKRRHVEEDPTAARRCGRFGVLAARPRHGAGLLCWKRYGTAVSAAGVPTKEHARNRAGDLALRTAAGDQVSGLGGCAGGSGGIVCGPEPRPLSALLSNSGGRSSGLTQVSGSFQGTGMFFGRSMSRV